MTGARRAVAIAAGVAVALVTLGATESPVTAEPDIPESAPVDKRVYMVADSVGLGARGALPDAFPSDWQVVLDGTPALFVEQLESKYVRAVPQSLLGDYGVVAGGYNYPYWDPARFDRSIDSIIRAFEERGVKHVFWVTLREVKPQYITAGAWNQVQPYYWYFPTVNDHLERALERHPEPDAHRLGGRRRSARDHVRRDPPQHHWRPALQLARPPGRRCRHAPSGRRLRHSDRGAGRGRCRRRRPQPDHHVASHDGLPDRVPVRLTDTGREQPQSLARSGRRLGGDRAREQFGRGVRVLVHRHQPHRRRHRPLPDRHRRRRSRSATSRRHAQRGARRRASRPVCHCASRSRRPQVSRRLPRWRST